MNKLLHAPVRATISMAALAVVLGLSACGGGGNDKPVDTPASPALPNSVGATATLSAPSSGEFAWQIDTQAGVVLKDTKGVTVPANAVTCVAQDSAQVVVKSDCSSIKALRVGELHIVASGAGVSAVLAVQGVPQRSWTGVHGTDRSTGGYSLVTLTDGRLLAWGSNDGGVLGQNKNVTDLASLIQPAPVMSATGIGVLNDVMLGSAGVDNGTALAKDGTVWSWGRNNSNALGRSESTYVNGSLLPVKVVDTANRGNLSQVVQVEAGDDRAVALIDDGTVTAWGQWPGDGHVDSGGKPVSTSLPTKVRAPDGQDVLRNVVAVSAGSSVSFALGSDGRVCAWGFDLQEGRLGMGSVPSTTFLTATPVVVKKADGQDLSNIVQISAGYNFTLALAADGTVWAWGANDSAQLGQNLQTYSGQGAAVQVKAPKGLAGVLGNIAMVSAGGRTGYAVTNDGKLYAWGSGTGGQLGDGPNASAGQFALLPVLVQDPMGAGPLTGVASIAGGYTHVLALLNDGSVLSWGQSYGGALGRTLPTQSGQDHTPGRVEMGNGTVLTLNTASYPNLRARAR